MPYLKNIIRYRLFEGIQNLDKISKHTEIKGISEEDFKDLKAAVGGCLMKLKEETHSQTKSFFATATSVVAFLELHKKTKDKMAANEKEKLVKPKATGHVMLSYNWAQKDLVKEVAKLLKAEGIKIWIDGENIQEGSLLESMASAVEGSDLVIIFYSDSYKRSPNCRTEAEYAYKKRKQMLFARVQEKYDAEGWLGALIKTDLYFDLTGGRFENSSKRLIEAAHRMLHSIEGAAGTQKGEDVISGHAS